MENVRVVLLVLLGDCLRCVDGAIVILKNTPPDRKGILFQFRIQWAPANIWGPLSGRRVPLEGAISSDRATCNSRLISLRPKLQATPPGLSFNLRGRLQSPQPAVLTLHPNSTPVIHVATP